MAMQNLVLEGLCRWLIPDFGICEAHLLICYAPQDL